MQMDRRNFLKSIAASAAIFGSSAIWSAQEIEAAKRRKPTRRKSPPQVTTESVFNGIMNSVQTENWKNYSIGALIGIIGMRLLNTPYVGGTLEVSETVESCVINLIELDCVTFFESSLCLARIIKKERYSIDDYIQELTFVRYRNGKIHNYASRLHYTADWIYDNVKKGVVDDITPVIGGERIKFDIFFMTDNSEQYPSLRRTPKLIAEIGSIEDSINKRDYYYIPTEKTPQFLDRIQMGDIICVVTSKEGLDYSHTGIAHVEKGVVRMLHASSKEKKVILDVELHEYLQKHPSGLGMTVVRPREIS